MYYCSVKGWQESERCVMGAISARAARWCSQKRDHLTFFFFSPKASGGNGESRVRGREMSDEGMGAPPVPILDIIFFRYLLSSLFLKPRSN